MTIRAYQEIYLYRAQAMLGDAFDYAINISNIPGEDFIKMFLASSACTRIENGEPTYLTGKSGIEVMLEIVTEATGQEPSFEIIPRYSRSCEYWIGWALAYYQWYAGRKFRDIFKVLSFQDLQKMYYTLHEADISKFVDIVDSLIREYFSDTNLKRIRNIAGLSQASLAKLSGVKLRSIQMYEQRNKDINKASALTVLQLSRALGCSIEDLLEAV